MSKYNKVHPGIYTQRGRLTPDEAARERRKQSATSPDRTSQPMSPKSGPAPATSGAAVRASKRVPATARARAAAASPSKAPTAKATAAKRAPASQKRKAVLARNAGGPGTSPGGRKRPRR